jgi:hypothetical protein
VSSADPGGQRGSRRSDFNRCQEIFDRSVAVFGLDRTEGDVRGEPRWAVRLGLALLADRAANDVRL